MTVAYSNASGSAHTRLWGPRFFLRTKRGPQIRGSALVTIGRGGEEHGSRILCWEHNYDERAPAGH